MTSPREIMLVYRRYSSPAEGEPVRLHDVAIPIESVDWQDVLACPAEFRSCISMDLHYLELKHPNMRRI